MEHMCNNDEEKICNIENQIANEACAIVQEETRGLDSETGGYNPAHLWKLKNKIMPKQAQVPTAMKGPNGRLLTGPDDLKNATLDYYKNVLRNRNIKDNLNEHKTKRETLCQRRLEQTKCNKTPPWTKIDLETFSWV